MKFIKLDRMLPYEKNYELENCKELIEARDILKAYVRYENEKWSCCVVVLDPDSGDKRDYFVTGKHFSKAEAEELLDALSHALN